MILGRFFFPEFKETIFFIKLRKKNFVVKFRKLDLCWRY